MTEDGLKNRAAIFKVLEALAEVNTNLGTSLSLMLSLQNKEFDEAKQLHHEFYEAQQLTGRLIREALQELKNG